MSEAHLVSVVIPVYNVAPYLREALDSVVGQTYNNLEVIIIDDGTTDGSGSVCDEYEEKDPRVRVIHQKNLGLAATRNVGVDAATTDYILFLDSDDWMEPNAVEILLGEAVLTGADVVCCRNVREGTRRPIKPKPARRMVYNGRQAVEALVCHGEVGNVAWGKLYRADVFKGIRYPEGRVFEDIATTWRVLDQVDIVVCIPDVLFHYRDREGSIANSRDMGNLVDYWIAYRERYEALSQRSPQMYGKLVEECMHAIIRFWCWYADCPRRDRKEHASETEEMAEFVKQHMNEVLHGSYSIKSKALVLACRWPNPLTNAGLYAATSLRRLLRGRRLDTIIGSHR